MPLICWMFPNTFELVSRVFSTQMFGRALNPCSNICPPSAFLPGTGTQGGWRPWHGLGGGGRRDPGWAPRGSTNFPSSWREESQHVPALQRKPGLKQQPRKRVYKKWSGGGGSPSGRPHTLSRVKPEQDSRASPRTDECALRPSGLPGPRCP